PQPDRPRPDPDGGRRVVNTGSAGARPIYLGSGGDTVFAWFHPAAAGVTPGAAVLILPPWGWDEVTSYRARRAWAEQLATGGHPTLRIDLPSAGDSGGSPDDPDRVEAWTTAAVEAARWLAA